MYGGKEKKPRRIKKKEKKKRNNQNNDLKNILKKVREGKEKSLVEKKNKSKERK